MTDPVDPRTDQAAQRDTSGRWTKGTCGNKTGRPAGAGWTQRTREELRAMCEPLIERLFAQAMAGDVGTSKLLLERAIAPARPGDEAVRLKVGDGLAAKSEAIIGAALTGKIGTQQASELLTALAAAARVADLADTESRLQALEAAAAAAQG